MSKTESKNRRGVEYKDIVKLFRESDCPVLTAGDLEDEFEFTNQAANYRLTSMVDEGTITKRKVGGAAAVYWLNEN